MKTNPLKEGVIAVNSVAVGTANPQAVEARAAELAVIDGRSAQEISKSECEQARRELTGEPESDPKEVLLESAPESERWDPLPGDPGHKVLATPSEDEDEEGRSDNARLVEEGVADAAHDQMLRASKTAKEEG
jgi:hypothetical protein